MRSRNRTSLTQGKTTVTIVSTGVTSQLGVYPTSSRIESMSDTVTPGYRKRAGRLPLPQNPLGYTCQKVTEEVSTMKMPNSSPSLPPLQIFSGVLCQWMTGSGVFGSPAVAPFPSYSVATMTANAKAKCLARFDRPNYSFGEPIAELKHLIQTVKDPFTTINKLLNRFRKERSSKPNKYVAGSKDLANLWAGYSFGIGPLVGSAVDAVEAYRQRNAVRFRYETVYASDRLDTGKMLREGASSSYGGWVSTRKSERQLTVVVKAGLFCSVVDNDTRGALLGLRARDLPGVAWELVPLSFMVDRIINVKRFINASASLLSNNVRILGGFVTTRVWDNTRRCHTDVRQGTIPSRKWIPSDSPSSYVENFSLTRAKWHPTVSDVWPRFENRLFANIHSTLDLISIVLGKLKIPVSKSNWSKKYGYRQHN